MSDFEYTPYFSPEHQSEAEFIFIEGRILIMTSQNTVIRMFNESSEHDHILHTRIYPSSEVETITIFFDQFEDEDEELFERLIDKGVSHCTDDYPDGETIL